MKNIKRVVALMLAMVMVFSLAGCGSTASTSNESSGKKKTIYVIVKVLGNQYWSIVQAGAEKAGQDLGCNVVIIGTSAETEIEKQVALLQDSVTAKADGIVIAPLDRKAMIAPIKEQFKSGIPMILIDSGVDSEDYSASYLTDNVAAGSLAAKTLIEKIKAAGTSETKEGVVAVTIGSTGSQAINDRDQGFKTYWDANAPKAWKVLWDQVKVNDGDSAKALAFGQDFIVGNKNLIGLFAPNNGSTVGFVKALQESGRSDIAMVGFDFSTEMQTIVKDSKFNVATILQKQYDMGYLGVKQALDLSNGGKVDKKVNDTGVMVVDIKNVNTDEVKAAAGIK